MMIKLLAPLLAVVMFSTPVLAEQTSPPPNSYTRQQKAEYNWGQYATAAASTNCGYFKQATELIEVMKLSPYFQKGRASVGGEFKGCGWIDDNIRGFMKYKDEWIRLMDRTYSEENISDIF